MSAMRSIAGMAALVMLTGPVFADSASDSRLQVIDYQANAIVRLDGFVGYAIHVEFAAGESLVNVAAGDLGAVEIGSEGQHVWVKPKFAPAHTNLSMLTNRRVYQFDYIAHRYANSSDRLVYSLRFRYPEVAVAKREPDAPAPKLILPPAPPPNLNYWFCGSPTLRPLRVFDDGIQTHVVFGARSELPAFFVKDADGESLVNFTVQGDEIVIHRIARQFVLRRGRLVGCLENRSFAGAGVALPNGAVDRTIRRAVAGEGS